MFLDFSLASIYRRYIPDKYYNIFGVIIFAFAFTYIIFKVIDYYKHKRKVNYLLKQGKKIDIKLESSSVKIQEHIVKKTTRRNNPSSIFLNDGLIGVNNDEPDEYYCIMKIFFTVDKKKYEHTIRVEMREFEINKKLYHSNSTTLIYDPNNPQNCIVDTTFMNVN